MTRWLGGGDLRDLVMGCGVLASKMEFGFISGMQVVGQGWFILV